MVEHSPKIIASKEKSISTSERSPLTVTDCAHTCLWCADIAGVDQWWARRPSHHCQRHWGGSVWWTNSAKSSWWGVWLKGMLLIVYLCVDISAVSNISMHSLDLVKQCKMCVCVSACVCVCVCARACEHMHVWACIQELFHDFFFVCVCVHISYRSVSETHSERVRDVERHCSKGKQSFTLSTFLLMFACCCDHRKVGACESGGPRSDAVRDWSETEAPRGAWLHQPHAAAAACVEPAEVERGQWVKLKFSKSRPFP